MKTTRSAIYRIVKPALLSACLAFGSHVCQGQPDPHWLDHDRTRPLPAVVTPATPGTPPSDATVLFDGKDLSQWASMDGTPTKWIVRDDYMECVQGSGYVRTLQSFGDCQLHIEWATPTPAHGEGQGGAGQQRRFPRLGSL